jgi:hypothetical protein
MLQSKVIFREVENYLLNFEHAERCSDSEIIAACQMHGDICATIDQLSSKLRMNYGEPKEEDYNTAEMALKNLDYLWSTATLGLTPKLHSLINHAVKQMRKIGGFGDMLEDDVEMIHQIAGRFEARSSSIKSHEMRALSHAKMEAVSHNKEMQMHIKQSQIQSKRKLSINKKHENLKRLKLERDEASQETIREVQNQPYAKYISAYDSMKEEHMKQG